jgi:hypothetical protein
MKKVFLSLLVAGFVTFGLQSCSKDDDDNGTPDVCEVCGSYSGTFDTGGDEATILLAPGVGLDNEVLEPTPFSAEVTEAAGDSLDILATLQVTVSGTAVPVPVTVRVGFNASNNTFAAPANQNVNITAAGIPIAVKLVSFSGSFTNNTTVSGTIVLDDQDTASADNIDATFYFTATK